MTPLNLRRRLRSALTILRGVSPDEAAEVRAAYRTAYDCGDDEPIADLMRHVLDEVQYQKRARDATDRALAEAVEERDKLRTELADVDEALYAALDINPASLQAATLYAPGGVRRLAAERDEAVAMISTVRVELAAATATLADVTCDRDSLIATVARLTGEATPKRKRTKEERADALRDRLGALWSSPFATGLRADMRHLGPATSRQIAMRMWGGNPPSEGDITNDMRLVSDLARAGYLTVAKGPGGVRVYSLKEGA